jgi:hypothetical protein
VVMLLGSLNPEIQENNVADTGIWSTTKEIHQLTAVSIKAK